MNFKNPSLVFSLIIIAFILYALTIIANIWPIDSITLGQAGVFGDSFGALTSLFTAFAFGGLIITIWQQQDELRQNREEIRIQHFENILFRMLEVHTEIVRGLDVRKAKTHEVIAVGRDCFPLWREYLQVYFEKRSAETGSEETLINDAYKEFWSKWNKDLGHYFRFLYNIFKHINNSKVKDKKLYANIVRAQISDHELFIIFYNCLHAHGKEKFKPLCEEYALFDNLPTELLLKKDHKNLYHTSAFG